MKPTLYLETSIIGYLAMRPSRVPRVAADQRTTRRWRDDYREQYELVASVYVIHECSAGDPTAAEERAVYFDDVHVLDITEDVDLLVESLMTHVPLPDKARIDAFHISVAAVHGVQYLLTWNCRHVANPSLRPRVERLCRERGHEPPEICTPPEFLERHHGT